MTKPFSLYLDAVRFLAALVVLLSHFAFPRFSGGDFIILRTLNLGSDAVVLFFVLSGLVIAYSVDVKDKSVGAYAFSRFTRIYSVVLPAIVLTFIFDTVGQRFDPGAYDGWWYHPVSVSEGGARALTFTSEWGLDSFRIGTNGPFWSVTYEVWYYVLFGLATFCRRPAALVAVIAGIVLGPKILLLMPAWLSGVLVYRAINRPLVLPPVLAWSLAVLPPVVYVTMLWASMPKMLLVLTWLVLGTDGVLSLGFSDEFLWNALIGGMVAAHFIGIAALLRDREAREGSGARLIRWLAGASFSLYLVHYPALQLFDALLPDMPEMLRNALLLISTLAVAFAFAELFERTLGVQRAGLRRMVVAAASWLRPASRDPLAMTAE